MFTVHYGFSNYWETIKMFVKFIRLYLYKAWLNFSNSIWDLQKLIFSHNYKIYLLNSITEAVVVKGNGWGIADGLVCILVVSQTHIKTSERKICYCYL